MRLRIANIIVAAGALLNISVHSFGDYGVPLSNLIHVYGWGVFDYGNLVSLLMIAIGCMLVSTGERFAACILTSIVFASLIYDATFGTQFKIGNVDIVFYIAGVLAMMFYIVVKALPLSKDKEFILMLCIPVIKIITSNLIHSNGKLINIYMLGVDRSFFEMGNALVYLLLAIYFSRATYQKTPVIPLLFLVDAVNEFRDNIVGNPYEFTAGEFLFITTGVILVLTYAINRKYRIINIGG